jgi:DNA repair exonuclease SbcCD nuclease subunit
MGLKILHSADWHLDSAFSAFPENQRLRLRQEQRKLPGRILEIAHANHVDMVLLSGDLLDGQGSPESVELLRRTLGEFGVPVLISPGNHDFCAPGSPWTQETWAENVHIFTRGLESVVLPELNCRVYGAGYQGMDCQPLLQDFSARGEEKYCIGLLHADPVVRNSPCCPVSASQVRESGLDYLALGHIHKAGQFRAGSTLCGWPGCPMGRGWDETGDKGVYLVTLDETAQIQRINLDFLRFYDLEAEADNLEQLLPAAGSEDFYRVTLTGEGPVDLNGLYSRFSHFPNLLLRDRTQENARQWENLDADSLLGTYFRFLKQSDDPHADLAAELSRQLLRGKEVQLL